jgi:PIN domain nuclease of toxin-antitoxin system
VRAGKWAEAEQIAADLAATVRNHDFQPLSVTLAHGALAGSLPGEHRDPFDRMLAAQAIIENAPLVTADRAFRGFDVAIIW